MNTKPNFFIIGAAKSGTTTLSHLLSKHDSVFFSPIKEPNYFSADIDPKTFKRDYKNRTVFVGDQYFRTLPLKEIHLSFVRDEDQYLKLFEAATNQIAVGEGSTSYLFSELAAKKIQAFNSEARIIAILRNPIHRAYSHYLMGLRFGYTHLSFRKAIEKDIAEKEKGWGISKLYIELGMYYQQLKRFYDTFPSSQIRIYLFEELEHHPQQLFNDLCDFLEIEPCILSEMKKQNEALLPKYPLINKLLPDRGLIGRAKELFPDSFQKWVKNIFYQDKDIPAITSDDHKFLRDYYLNDVLQTAELIKKDLKHWVQ